MTVTTPPRPPKIGDERSVEERIAELEAVIKEARQRARRRRAAYIAVVLVALAAAVAGTGGIGGGGGVDVDASVKHGSPATATNASRAGEAAIAASPLYVSAIQVDPTRPNVVYASTLGGGLGVVIKSTDGGQTWSAATNGLTTPSGLPGVPAEAEVRVDALAIDPRSPNVLYAGTGVGVFKTTDGARTWKLATTGIELYRDSPGHGFLEGLIVELAVDPRHASTVYALSGGVWKTTNGGVRWKKVLGRDIVDLAIDPRRPEIMYATPRRQDAAPRGSIYRTVDGGRSWRATRPTTLNVNFSEPVVVDRRGVLYAGAWKGLFASANQGRTWRTLLPLQKGARGVGGIGAIALDPSRDVLHVGTNYGVVKSEDGGQTWSAPSLDGRSVSAVAVAPTRPHTIYAGAGGVFASRDGGATWRRLF